MVLSLAKTFKSHCQCEQVLAKKNSHVSSVHFCTRFVIAGQEPLLHTYADSELLHYAFRIFYFIFYCSLL